MFCEYRPWFPSNMTCLFFADASQDAKSVSSSCGECHETRLTQSRCSDGVCADVCVCVFVCRCCCGRLVRQHVGFTATLAVKYSDVRLTEGELSDLEQWSVEKHTEESPTDAYGVINFQGGSHSYRAKVWTHAHTQRTFRMILNVTHCSVLIRRG